MKSVLISIQPKWCELIARGIKTVEVRKSKPKLQTPFKCYIYCTLPPQSELFTHGSIREYANELIRLQDGRIVYDYGMRLACEEGEYSKDNFLCKKVIGEFVCDRVDEIKDYTVGIGKEEHYLLCSGALEGTCLTGKEMYGYGKGKPLYGWHISDLKIYDKPKELSEFYIICTKPPTEITCRGCPNKAEYCFNKKKPIKRPFQSWGYVEE